MQKVPIRIISRITENQAVMLADMCQDDARTISEMIRALIEAEAERRGYEMAELDAELVGGPRVAWRENPSGGDR